MPQHWWAEQTTYSATHKEHALQMRQIRTTPAIKPCMRASQLQTSSTSEVPRPGANNALLELDYGLVTRPGALHTLH